MPVDSDGYPYQSGPQWASVGFSGNGMQWPHCVGIGHLTLKICLVGSFPDPLVADESAFSAHGYSATGCYRSLHW